MAESDTLRGKRVALLGLGKANTYVLAYLVRHGARVTVRDAKTDHAIGQGGAPWEKRGVTFRYGPDWLDDLDEGVLFRSPGVRPDLPPLLAAAARGATVTGEWAFFADRYPGTLLAVTGSDGKTTTAHLAHALLSAAYGDGRVGMGGNMGLPLITRLDGAGPDDFTVAELSSFQLMTPMRPPARAVITNLSENHLNWHRDMAEYVAAKRSLLAPGTAAVLNAENPYTAAFARERENPADCVFSSFRDTRVLRAAFPGRHTLTMEGDILRLDGVEILPRAALRLPGVHNAENFLAALGLVYPYLSDPVQACRTVAATFEGVRHRLEVAGRAGGVLYYNSSIDTSPTRTAAALRALDRRPVLLLGGAEKGIPFTPLRPVCEQYAAAVILFGAAAGALEAALSGITPPVLRTGGMRDAVLLARRMAKPGDTVLLSPACTSFDEFTDFAERGDVFCAMVRDFENTEDVS